jgi:hypothetical protein
MSKLLTSRKFIRQSCLLNLFLTAAYTPQLTYSYKLLLNLHHCSQRDSNPQPQGRGTPYNRGRARKNFKRWHNIIKFLVVFEIFFFNFLVNFERFLKLFFVDFDGLFCWIERIFWFYSWFREIFWFFGLFREKTGFWLIFREILGFFGWFCWNFLVK